MSALELHVRPGPRVRHPDHRDYPAQQQVLPVHVHGHHDAEVRQLLPNGLRHVHVDCDGLLEVDVHHHR